MKPSQRCATTPTVLSALAGLTAGLTIVASTGDAIAIGGGIAGFAALALCMVLLRKWVTDTSSERRELRAAIRAADKAREENQVATAITMGERERARSETATAKAEARQAQVNYDQRARAAERDKDREIDAEKARLRHELEENWARVKVDAYKAGVLNTLSGQIDMVILDAPDATVITLDEHRDERRPTGTDGRITRS